MTGEATREVTRKDRIYCLKASSDYHRELCEECRFYPNCDHVTQDDMTELTIKDLETLEQEPFKPMVEIDLYSVIKQKYIEREVLDEIRTEIEEQVFESLSDGGDDWFTAEKVNECLEIIDKYKAESEVKE